MGQIFEYPKRSSPVRRQTRTVELVLLPLKKTTTVTSTLYNTLISSLKLPQTLIPSLPLLSHNQSNRKREKKKNKKEREEREGRKKEEVHLLSSLPLPPAPSLLRLCNSLTDRDLRLVEHPPCTKDAFTKLSSSLGCHCHRQMPPPSRRRHQVVVVVVAIRHRHLSSPFMQRAKKAKQKRGSV